MKKEHYLDPVEIELGLRRAIEKSKQNFIGTNFIPHTYTVVVDDKAYEEYGDLLNTLGKMLGDSLDTWIMDKGYEKDGPALVQFEKGQTQGRTFLVQISYRAMDEPAPAAEAIAEPPEKGGEEKPAPEELSDEALQGRLVHDDSGRAFTVEEKALVVGRGPGCGIRLTEETVSEKHAQVRVEYGRITLEDLSSTNGTRVNLKRVKKTTLSDGDRVSFGGVGFTFQTRAPIPGEQEAAPRPVAERTWRRRRPFMPRNGNT